MATPFISYHSSFGIHRALLREAASIVAIAVNVLYISHVLSFHPNETVNVNNFG